MSQIATAVEGAEGEEDAYYNKEPRRECVADECRLAEYGV